jgi:hypothetical protein
MMRGDNLKGADGAKFERFWWEVEDEIRLYHDEGGMKENLSDEDQAELFETVHCDRLMGLNVTEAVWHWWDGADALPF